MTDPLSGHHSDIFQEEIFQLRGIPLPGLNVPRDCLRETICTAPGCWLGQEADGQPRRPRSGRRPGRGRLSYGRVGCAQLRVSRFSSSSPSVGVVSSRAAGCSLSFFSILIQFAFQHLLLRSRDEVLSPATP